jgi:hypothetical protein
MQQAEGTHPWLYVLSQQDDISKSPACLWRMCPHEPRCIHKLALFWQLATRGLLTSPRHLSLHRLAVCNFLLVVGTCFTSALHGQFLVPCLPLTLTGSAAAIMSESFHFWLTNFQKASSIPLYPERSLLCCLLPVCWGHIAHNAKVCSLVSVLRRLTLLARIMADLSTE